MESNTSTVNTVHESIDLFRNNPDLIPGSKGFDRELATRFLQLAKPYELRVDDALYGYTIPVAPIIAQLRAQLVAERAKTPDPPSPPDPSAGPVKQKPKAEPPQAAISSKAGNSSDQKEDYSTLFGTLGLPDFRI